MGFDMATQAAILKTVFEPEIREQLNYATVLSSLLKKYKRVWKGGKEAKFALRKGGNTGVGSRSEDVGVSGNWNTLPTPGQQQYDNAIYRTVYLYGTIRITRPAMSATKSDAGAYARALQSEQEGLALNLKQLLNRVAWKDGSAILTQTVSNAAGTITVLSTKHIQVGQEVQFHNGADGTSKNHANGFSTVTSITSATVFVVDSAPGSALDADDVVILRGTRNPTSAGTWGVPSDPWGLDALVSDSNPAAATGLTQRPGDIDRSVAAGAFFKSNVLPVAGTLTMVHMQQAFDLTDIASDHLPGAIVTSYGGKIEYGKLLTPDRRYPAGGPETILDGGYKALDFNGAHLVADKDASQVLNPSLFGKMYFLTLSSFYDYVSEDWQWEDSDGAVLCRNPNKHSFDAVMFSFRQYAIIHPNRNTVATGITGA